MQNLIIFTAGNNKYNCDINSAILIEQNVKVQHASKVTWTSAISK